MAVMVVKEWGLGLSILYCGHRTGHTPSTPHCYEAEIVIFDRFTVLTKLLLVSPCFQPNSTPLLLPAPHIVPQRPRRLSPRWRPGIKASPFPRAAWWAWAGRPACPAGLCHLLLQLLGEHQGKTGWP